MKYQAIPGARIIKDCALLLETVIFFVDWNIQSQNSTHVDVFHC